MRIPPRLILSSGIALLVTVPLPAQERPAPPVFKTGTEIVLVDFVVNDKSDRPLTGLTAADFVVKEDGKERPIVSFAAFANTAQPPGATVRETPRIAGPATVILVDDGHLTAEQTLRLRPDVKALLATVGSRSGTLSLVAPFSQVSEGRTLPFGAQALAAAVDRIVGHRIDDHTDLPVSDAEAIAVERGDRQMLTRLASRFMAVNMMMKPDQADALGRSRSREVATEARVRRQELYEAADGAFDWLASQPGRHSLVIVSPGFARDPEDPGYDRIVTRSLRTNAPVSFLDTRGLEAFSRFDSVTSGSALPPGTGEAGLARTDSAQGAAVLADDTGGVIVRNTNDLQKGLGRLFDAMETYYVLGYERPPHPKTGYRKIKVETRAKDATVRARRGYFDGEPARR